jgi:hypothetical protein
MKYELGFRFAVLMLIGAATWCVVVLLVTRLT